VYLNKISKSVLLILLIIFITIISISMLMNFGINLNTLKKSKNIDYNYLYVAKINKNFITKSSFNDLHTKINDSIFFIKNDNLFKNNIQKIQKNILYKLIYLNFLQELLNTHEISFNKYDLLNFIESIFTEYFTNINEEKYINLVNLLKISSKNFEKDIIKSISIKNFIFFLKLYNQVNTLSFNELIFSSNYKIKFNLYKFNSENILKIKTNSNYLINTIYINQDIYSRYNIKILKYYRIQKISMKLLYFKNINNYKIYDNIMKKINYLFLNNYNLYKNIKNFNKYKNSLYVKKLKLKNIFYLNYHVRNTLLNLINKRVFKFLYLNKVLYLLNIEKVYFLSNKNFHQKKFKLAINLINNYKYEKIFLLYPSNYFLKIINNTILQKKELLEHTPIILNKSINYTYIATLIEINTFPINYINFFIKKEKIKKLLKINNNIKNINYLFSNSIQIENKYYLPIVKFNFIPKNIFVFLKNNIRTQLNTYLIDNIIFNAWNNNKIQYIAFKNK